VYKHRIHEVAQNIEFDAISWCRLLARTFSSPCLQCTHQRSKPPPPIVDDRVNAGKGVATSSFDKFVMPKPQHLRSSHKNDAQQIIQICKVFPMSFRHSAKNQVMYTRTQDEETNQDGGKNITDDSNLKQF
jgi:hypothetical protein